MSSRRGHIPASFEKSPKTSIHSNQTDRCVPQPFTLVNCIANQCLIEIGQRFEDFAKYVDELGKEIEEDGKCLFDDLIGLENETFDEAEKNTNCSVLKHFTNVSSMLLQHEVIKMAVS